MSIDSIFNKYRPTLRHQPLHYQSCPLLQLVLPLIACSPYEKKLERLSEKEKRDLIEQHSLLDLPINDSFLRNQTPPFSNEVHEFDEETISLFSQIHADAIIGGSPYEKLSLKRALETWLKCLKRAKSIKISPALISHIEQLISICSIQEMVNQKNEARFVVEAASKICEKIFQMPIGTTTLLEAGQRDEKGIYHPVILIFHKKEGQIFNLMVAVAGKERESFRRSIEQASKIWFDPWDVYENIPADQLFFNHQSEKLTSDFFQAILETQLNPDLSKNFITHHVLGHLQHFRVDKSTLQRHHFVSLPNSYSEAWKIGKILVLEKVNTIEEYKKLIAEIKFQTLIEGYQCNKKALEQDCEKSEKIRILLEHGSYNFIKSLLVLTKRYGATEEEITPLRATALDLLERVKKINREIKERRLVHFDLLAFDIIDDIKSRAQLIQKSDALFMDLPQAMYEPSVTSVRLFEPPPPAELLDFLSRYLLFLPHEQKVIAFEMEMVVEALSIPNNKGDSYWSQIPDAHLVQIVESFHKILNHYDRSTIGDICITPRGANCVFALYAFIHYLALRIEKMQGRSENFSSLKNYSICFPGLECDRDPFLIFTSSQEFERREKIIAYFINTWTHSQTIPREMLFDFSENSITLTTQIPLKSHFQWLFCNASGNKAFKIDVADKITYIEELLSDCFLEKITESCFAKGGFGYIPILVQAAYLTHQFSSYSALRLSRLRKSSPRLQKLHHGELLVKYFSCDEKPQSNSLSMHPTLTEDYQKWLSAHPWNSRQKKSDTRKEEGETLKKGNELLRRSCEPILYPYKLLSYYQDRLDLFCIYDEQVIFEIEFFRSVSFNDLENIENEAPLWRDSFFPIKEELNKPHLKEQCRRFIHAGLERYLHHLQRPAIFPTLFFIRFAIRLVPFVDDSKLFEARDCLTNILKRKDLSGDEQSAVSLHLVAALMCQKDLTENDLQVLFEAWVFYKNHPLPQQLRSPHFEREIEIWVYKIASKLESLKETTYRTIIEKTLEQLSLEKLLPILTASVETPYSIRIKLSDTSFWHINLLTGQLSDRNGPYQKISPPAIAKTPFFSALFGTEATSFMQSANILYFQHPRLGLCRIIGDDSIAGLQRCISQVWYQFIPHEEVITYRIPYSLIVNHTHWLAPASSSIRILIDAHPTGRRVASILSKGGIFQDNDQFYGADSDTILTRFELPEFIVYATRNGRAHSLQFSRYYSLEGEPLFFDFVENQVLYRANRNYLLSNEQKQGCLNGIKNYLYLCHKESGKEKILVPCKGIAHYSSLGTNHSIINNKLPTPNPDGFIPNERIAYLEYDLIGGTATPRSQEGSVFLAYLLLSTRNYQKALSHIRSLDFRESFSPLSLSVLKMMVNLVEDGNDRSGEAAAVALHALSLFEKVQLRLLQPPNKNKEYNPLTRKAYHRFAHRLPLTLLLSKDQLKDLPDENKEFVMSSYPTLKEFKPITQRGFGKVLEKKNKLFKVEKVIDYSQDVEQFDYNSIIVKHTHFLPHPSVEKPNYNFNCPLFLFQTNPEGVDYFTEAYNMAKFGSSGQRAQIAFQLQLIGEKYVENPPEAWTYLQFVLNYPDKAPYLPPHTDYEERWNFIKQLSLLCIQARAKKNLETPKLEVSTTRCPPDFISRSLPAIAKHKPAPDEVNPPLLLAIPLRKEIDSGFLASLFEKHFSSLDQSDPQFSSALFTYQHTWLSQAEAIYEKAFQADLIEFQKDFEVGQKINQEEVVYLVNYPMELYKRLEDKIVDLKLELSKLETTILEIANQKSSSPLEQQLQEEANIKEELTIRKLAILFLKGNRGCFLAANPNLKDPSLIAKLAKAYGVESSPQLVVDSLYQLLGIFLNLSVYTEQLIRAQKHALLICKISNSDDPYRFFSVQKLALELNPLKQADYSLKTYSGLLAYEYLDTKTLYIKQVNALKNFLEINPISQRYNNCVQQLPMGLGKTDVIAKCLLLMAMAQPGRLLFFVTTLSQYTTVKNDFRKAQYAMGEQRVEELEVTQRQISTKMLLEYEQRLVRAKQKGYTIIVTDETLKCLRNEFTDLIFQLCDQIDQEVAPEKFTHLNVLRRIYLMFTESDALIDEVHEVLDVMQVMDFPIGFEEQLDPTEVDAIKTIFSILSKESVPVNAERSINLKKQVGLEENRQTLLSIEELQGDVARAVAYNLCCEYAPLGLQNKTALHEALYRYITGKIDPQCQRYCDEGIADEEWELLSKEMKEDTELLNHFAEAEISDKKEIQKSVSIASVIRHMFLIVLPATFQNKGNQHYGQSKEKPGETRPYRTVDTPSDNLHGYFREASAYYFQAAIQLEISQSQIKNVSSVLQTQAEKRAKAEKIPISQTKEAQDFNQWTSIDLLDVHNPSLLKKAEVHLRENVESRIAFAKMSILQHVRFYPEKLSATSCCIPNMFASTRTMSGTPSKTICFNPSLADKFIPDVGTEGQIAAKVLARACNELSLYPVNGNDPLDILNQLYDYFADKEGTPVILESAALVKCSTEKAALHLRARFNKPVLFFTFDTKKNQKSADTLAIWKLNSDTPILIGGTRLEEIEKSGVALQDCVIYLDERHTSGTDLKLPPNAKAIMTVNETMTRDKFSQTIKRLRDFSLLQTCVFAMHMDILVKLPPITFQDMQVRHLLQAQVMYIKNQAIAKSNQYKRFCKLYINELFENTFFASVIPQEITHDVIRNRVLPFRNVVVHRQSKELSWKVGHQIDGARGIKNYGEQKLSAFAGGNPSEALLTKMKGEVDAFVERAVKSPYLPSSDIASHSEDLGVHVYVMKAEESQTKVNLQTQVELALLEQMKVYTSKVKGKMLPEHIWQEDHIKKTLKKLQSGLVHLSEGSNVFPLADIFKPPFFTYSIDFSQIFDQRIVVTHSWAKTIANPISVFHSLQRPADSLLILKINSGYRGLLLAQNECRQFKDYLEEHKKQEVWLLQTSGDLFCGNAPLPIHEDITFIFMQCHLFNGSIEHLQFTSQTIKWFTENHNRIEFMKLKISNDTNKLKLFLNRNLFEEAVT